MGVFNLRKKGSHLDSPMFLGEPVDIARYDMVRYPQIDRLTDKQVGFYWGPDEVDVSRDKIEFEELTDAEKHIFTSNLKRQIVLDSVQGRSVNLALLPITSAPELETWIETWGFFETIHSRSYTHIIRNVYPDPSIVFDGIKDIKEIVDCGRDISKYYDDLIEYNSLVELLGYGTHTINGDSFELTAHQHKKRLWLALHAINALEGIRFYVSFACSWAFAELKKMEGNAKIIKLIARDENLHLASSIHIIREMRKDPEFAKIDRECQDLIQDMFIEVINQEKEWAQYLFAYGSIIGLNAKLLESYVEWIGAKRMRALSIDCPYKVSKANPLPWTEKWIGGGSVQVAPQETEVTSYVTGGVDQNINSDTLKGLSL